MRTKKFKGPAVQSVMDEIREVLGDDALIVSMSESTSGIEIEAGVETPVNTPALDSFVDLGEPIPLQTVVSEGGLRDVIERVLLKQGVKFPHVQKIISHVPLKPEAGRSVDYYVGLGLEQTLDWHSLLPFESKAVALIGATGVGKTTTIAKLAARLRMAFDLTVGLISADTYRVGAGFHLETYATLLRLPFRSTGGADDTAKALKSAIEDLSACDLILIDTAGCGPREKGRVSELHATFAEVPEVERLLVLPAPSNDFDLHAAAHSFELVGFDRVILTKLDESGFVGPIINTVMELQRPLAFMTDGQRVPEDIEPASARRLGWMATRLMH